MENFKEMSDDKEAKQFLSYLRDQRLSVFSKDDLLFSYSVFRAQLRTSTRECDAKSLLHALRRIHAIKFWRDQHIEWIPGVIPGVALPGVETQESADDMSGMQISASQQNIGQDIDGIQRPFCLESLKLGSCKDKRNGPTEEDIQTHAEVDQLDEEEEIVWLGQSKFEVGVSCNGKDTHCPSFLHNARKSSMTEDGKEFLDYRKKVSKSRNGKNTLNPVASQHQYLLLQELFEKTHIEENGKSTMKDERMKLKGQFWESGKDGVRVRVNDSELKKASTSASDYGSYESSAQRYGRDASNSSRLETGNCCTNGRKDMNSSRGKEFNFNSGAKANQAGMAGSSSVVYGNGAALQGCGPRTPFCPIGRFGSSPLGSHPPKLPMPQYYHDCKMPVSDQTKNSSQAVMLDYQGMGQQPTTKACLAAGKPGTADSSGRCSGQVAGKCRQSNGSESFNSQRPVKLPFGENHKHNWKLKHFAISARETQLTSSLEIEGRGKVGGESPKELHYKVENGENELDRNWIANQKIGAGDLFVSQPFSFSHDRPQTIAIGGTEAATISVVNNGKDPAALKRVQMLHARPKGSFGLSSCSPSDVAATKITEMKPDSRRNLCSSESKKNLCSTNFTSISSGGLETPVSLKSMIGSYPGHSLTGGPWILEPGCHLTLGLRCTAKEMGLHKAVILFDFGGKKIVKYVTLMGEDDIAKKLAPNEPYSRKPRPKIRKSAFFYRGRPPPCPLFSKRLEKYPIPKHVRDALLQNETLPVFLHGLSMDTYSDYFASLLYAEEFQMEADIRVYDMQNVTMKFSSSDFLVLRVPGLVERRPSVIYRDAIYVRLSGSNGKEYQGFVYKVHAEEVYLKFNNFLHKASIANQRFDVRFSCNRITLRRAHQALNFARNLPENVIFPSKLCSTASLVSLKEISPFNRVLNEEQKGAVQEILKQAGAPPYLIYGPPGTGKTVTVVEAILQVLRCYPGARVLACAPSNSASDLLLERLIGPVQQREMLRLNAYTRPLEDVPPNLRSYCSSENLFFCCPTQEELLKYKVVVSTYWSAGMLDAQGISAGHFTHIFLDEAGQGMEPEAMVVIANLANLETVVVLAGDQCQLGPVIRCNIAEKFGLGKSFLERLSTLPLYTPVKQDGRRLLKYNTSVVTKLVRNYRSHPAILDLPSRLFYNSELIACAPEESRSSLCDWEELPNKNFPVLFIGIEGRDEREGTSPSWFNAQEASKVIEIVKKLKNYRRNRVINKDIGIISPYNQQVNKLKWALVSENMQDIKVGSVEQFQGQEKRVIIISTVRSSKEYVEIDKHHNLGFLRNPKRFNVAITRAKALLVIVGNPYVLSQDFYWNELLRYCILHQSYVGCSPPSEESTAEAKLFHTCMEKLFPAEVLEKEDNELPSTVKAAVEEMQWPDGTF